MKTAKSIGLFAAGIMALVFAGCFNPISVVPPKTLVDPLAEPFTVDVLIGKDQARSVTGPDMDRIKTGSGIRNIVQLIVVDTAGNIVAFDETRRQSDTDTAGELRLESLHFGQTYHFLLLMGYWDRVYGQTGPGGTYLYKEDVPPTLLAAGLKSQEVTGSGKVTITMWPIVVDTVFTTTNQYVPETSRTVVPVIEAGNPKKVNLLPVDWKITWKVQRGGTNGDGFAELIKAQKVIPQVNSSQILLKSQKIIVREKGQSDVENTSPSFTGNSITLDIGTYTSGITRIGKEGSATFKLEYVPFNLRDVEKWAAFKVEGKSKFKLNAEAPVWIIRNGVNDQAQTDQTNFQTSWNGTINGNGAVCFAVEAPQSEQMVIENGKFEGPQNVSNPKIGFTTKGYTGQAEVYYAVVSAETGAPGYSAYTKSLGQLGTGTHTAKEISLPSPYPPSNHYDIYVLLLKEGKISKPIKISTTDYNYLEPWTTGRFVAISDTTNNAAFSSDGGLTWRQITLPSGGTGWRKVVFGKGMFVAIGSQAAAWSADGGNTWTQATLPNIDRDTWADIAYGNNMFVALAWQDSKPYVTPRAAYSTDGKTWNLSSSAMTGYWLDVVYGSGKFVAVAHRGRHEYRTGPYAAYSTDGRSWTNVTDPNMEPIASGDEFDWCGVAYGNNTFVAVSDKSYNPMNSDDNLNRSYVAYSTNGVNWTQKRMPDDDWHTLAFGNGTFVAIAVNSKQAAYSTNNGQTWNTATLPSAASWQAVTFGNNRFVAVAANSNQAAYSTNNGRNWNTATLPAARWISVAYGAP